MTTYVALDWEASGLLDEFDGEVANQNVPLSRTNRKPFATPPGTVRHDQPSREDLLKQELSSWDQIERENASYIDRRFLGRVNQHHPESIKIEHNFFPYSGSCCIDHERIHINRLVGHY